MQQDAFSTTSARTEESGKPALVEGVGILLKNNRTGDRPICFKFEK